MTHTVAYSDYKEVLEYHGNTAVELKRKRGGVLVSHEWLLFDSVCEAESYFYENQDPEVYHA